VSEREGITPEEAADYLRNTKLREAAEAKHGREEIERVTEEYRQLRHELQSVPHPERIRRKELLLACARLERKYGYEVLSGVPRITKGSHPRHGWSI
jgi:hypothetical protein